MAKILNFVESKELRVAQLARRNSVNMARAHVLEAVQLLEGLGVDECEVAKLLEDCLVLLPTVSPKVASEQSLQV